MTPLGCCSSHLEDFISVADQLAQKTHNAETGGALWYLLPMSMWYNFSHVFSSMEGYRIIKLPIPWLRAVLAKARREKGQDKSV